MWSGIIIFGMLLVFIWAVIKADQPSASSRDDQMMLRYELQEAQSEIARHHDTFVSASAIIESMRDNLRNFEGDDPNMVVGTAQDQVRQLRSIIPPP